VPRVNASESAQVYWHGPRLLRTRAFFLLLPLTSTFTASIPATFSSSSAAPLEDLLEDDDLPPLRRSWFEVGSYSETALTTP
jgi:hypothetical protein